MRDMQEVVSRFFDVRKRWRGLGSARNAACSEEKGGLRRMDPDDTHATVRRMLDERNAEMKTLAWVLGIDLGVMDGLDAYAAPRPMPDGLEPVTEVTVTHVERLNRWYMEVPASSDPQWRTAYWSALLTGTQIRQLATALLGAYTQLRSKRLKVGIVAGPLLPARSDDDVERDLTPTA